MTNSEKRSNPTGALMGLLETARQVGQEGPEVLEAARKSELSPSTTEPSAPTEPPETDRDTSKDQSLSGQTTPA